MRMILLTLSLVLVATSSAFGLGYFYRRQSIVYAHSPIRSIAILSQADQAEQVGAIIVGDSITELSYLPEMCGRRVLNAGVGGAKAHEVIELLRDVLRRVKTDRVVIAIGVNDAGKSYATDIKSFGDSYRELVGIAAAAGAQVIVATIAPVGHDLPEGTGIFDTELIKNFNAEIRNIAIEHHAGVAEVYKDLAAKDGFLPHDFTVDGVHLTKIGYQPWLHALEYSACGSS
ncbi:SGNH/GDSL hydrolase family protein [Methylocella sp.]|jgi:lysophospholipase L1-like esterase|uniref:SGNH/GDSL hydrolase family protein n=1 Tax=Methylocella sp. TaxID=1978226 RepID=UPI003C19E7A1